MATTKAEKGPTTGSEDELNRAQVKEVLADMLGVLRDDLIYKAFSIMGIRDIYDFQMSTIDAFKGVRWVITESSPSGHLPTLQINKIKAVKSWFQSVDGPAKGLSAWEEFTYLNFATYLLNYDADQPFTKVEAPQTVMSHGGIGTSAPEMLTGVKRGIEAYPRLRDDKFWLSFHRSLVAVAATHALSEVLNTKYIPTANNKENFKLKCQYMYSVFVNILLTTKSRTVVRNHQETLDGQGVYRDLVKAYADGTSARIAGEGLEDQFKAYKLDKSWNKGLEHFLHTWSAKLQDLETIRDATMSDADKRRILITAVKGHSDLYQGILTALAVEESNKALNNQGFKWDQFYNFVLDHAQTVDSNKPSTRKLRANQSNQKSNNGKGKKKTGFIPLNEWKKLSNEQKDEIRKQRRDAAAQKQGQQGPASRINNQSNVTTRSANNTTQSVSTASGQLPQNDSATVSTTTTTQSSVPAPTQALAQRFLNQAVQQPQATLPAGVPDAIVFGNITYRASKTKVNYHISQSQVSNSHCGSLIDRGANGGLSGNDVRVLEESTVDFADVDGIGEGGYSNVPLCTVAGLLQSLQGPVIGIFHQYAHTGEGHTLHSPLQLEHFGQTIAASGLTKGHRLHMTTLEGFDIPFRTKQGLVYMPMKAPTDEELEAHPHVIMTHADAWDPSIYDVEASYDVEQADPIIPEIEEDNEPTLDDHVLIALKAYKSKVKLATPKSWLPKKPDLDKLRPLFGWIPDLRIQHTLKNTTQWYKAEGRLPMRRHFKSRFPGANVPRRNETVATDTFFSDTPAWDDGLIGHGGARMMQLYCGCTSEYLAGFPMVSDQQVSKTLLDFIRSYGAPNTLFSDNAKSETSKAIQDILRHYTMGQATSEPYCQHQNPAERRIGDLKRQINVLMDRTGTPPEFWLLCALHLINLHNHLASTNLENCITPIQKAFGHVPDISKFLQFHWWQKVLYKTNTSSFPSSTYEGMGRFVGVAEHVGDVLTYQVLTDDTLQVISRSLVRPVDPDQPNYRVMMPQTSGEEEGPHEIFVKNLTETMLPEYQGHVKLPKFSPDELIGVTFLHDTSNGERVRAEIVKKINDIDSENHHNIKFLIQFGDPCYEEIISYTELSDIVEKQLADEPTDEERLYIFKEIMDHEGPISKTSDKYMGSTYNVKIKWEDGSITWEPLTTIGKDDPGSCATYGQQHGLLDLDGWKRFKRLAKREKKKKRMINQAAMAAKRKGKKYKFGVQVPRNENEARELEKKFGHTKWAAAEKVEVDQLNDYESFRNHGRGPPPRNYKVIKVFFVYDVKHDFRYKARLVAGGHMTEDHGDAYSSVISLKGMRIAILAGEVNGLKSMVGDVGNAYLEAYTKEKVCFVAGPAFGELEGCILIIVKALYGLRTSGARYHERFADTLRDLGFTPCRNEADLWMRDKGDHYEYVCVYVDDLMAIMKNPEEFFKTLQETYKYKLKGVGEPEYHLGGNYFCNPDGTLVWGAQRYIDRLIENFERTMGYIPQKYRSPMDHNCYPELDTSPALDLDGIKKYQSILGALQWCVTLGRFDIAYSVMALARFRAEPKENHLKMLGRVVGYLRHTKLGAIRFRTNIPNHEEKFPLYKPADWDYSVYHGVREEIPGDIPRALGKPVRLTTYVDANLLHCRITGRSASGVLHLVNGTPIDAFSKRQNTVETATYGSEFMAARLAVQQTMDIRLTLRYMGVPIDGPTWMFGDNKSVIDSSTIPASTLNKRHNALSYHLVRSAIASKMIKFFHIPGEENISDVLTKPLEPRVLEPLLLPFLIKKGKELGYSVEKRVQE